MRFMEETVSALQTEIEARLAGVEPEVEVLLAEVAGPTLRLFIDHPDGVTLDCASGSRATSPSTGSVTR